MNKETKKLENRKRYNQVVVQRLIKKYGVSMRFVHMALNNDRRGELAETIKKEYPILVAKVEAALTKI